MQYGTESKLYFKAYKDDGTTVTSLGDATTCWISKDGGAFHACTNTPVYVGNYSWFCLTLTATETTCDSLVIKVTPSTSGITVQDIIGEPQRVTPATDTSTLATASAVSALQTSVNAIPTTAAPTAQNIWEYSSRTLTSSTGVGGAIAQEVWEYATRTLTASPTDISGLATTSALSSVASNVSAVKAKTDNLPSSPAATGDAMTLTSAYDAAKTASQFDASTDTVEIGSTSISSIQSGLATSSDISYLETYGDTYWATATGFATTSDLARLSTFDPTNDTVTINSTQAATMTTATGFATPSDLTGLSTFDPSTDTVTIDSTQAATMVTATGFATPSDIPTASANASAVWGASTRTVTNTIPSASDNASAIWGASSRTLTASPTDISGLATASSVSALQTSVNAIPTTAAPTAQNIWEYTTRTLTSSGSGGATAQEVWEYSARTLTASPTDISSLATASDLSDVASDVSAIKAKTDNLPASPAATGAEMALTSAAISSVQNGLSTASALSSVASNVSAVKAKTDNLPASPAATGDAMTLTAAYDAAKTASQFDASTDTVEIGLTSISAVQSGLATSSELSSLESHGDSNWATATGFATASDLSGLSTFDPANDTVTIDSTQAATMVTATGFATPSDLVGLSTFDPSNDTVTINSTQAATMVTATGFATPSDLAGLSTFDPTNDAVTINSTQAATMTTATGFATPNDIPSASDNASAVWGASTRTVTNTIPSASDNATAVWGASTRTLTASPTDVSGLATATDLGTLQDTADAIKAKTDNLPSSPAAVGSAMTLTSAYDPAKTAAPTAQNIWEYTTRTLTSSGSGGATAQEVWEYSGGRSLTEAVTLTSDYNAAKTAAQAGDAMTLTNAYDSAKTAAQAGDAMTLTIAYDKAKTAAAPGDAMTLTSAYDASKTAAPTAAAVASAVWSETTRTITGIPSTVTDLLNQLHALLGDWTMGQTTLTTSEGNYTLTRDNDGNIIAVTPSSQGS